MTTYERVSLLVLRVSMGWLFLYAGITKVLNPEWSAAGYLNSAKTFQAVYAWLASPSMIDVTNFVNAWGLTILGCMLLIGFATRLVGVALAGLMVLYYFPVLDFPYPNAHSLLVDDHIIYAVALVVLVAFRAGRVWGVDQKYRLAEWLG